MQNNKQGKPIHFYVANLGSEVQRIFVWKEKEDREAMLNAYKRAVSIINKIKDFNNKSADAEMDILQKSLEEFTFDSKKSALNRDQISSYFNPFALRVINSL